MLQIFFHYPFPLFIFPFIEARNNFRISWALDFYKIRSEKTPIRLERHTLSIIDVTERVIDSRFPLQWVGNCTTRVETRVACPVKKWRKCAIFNAWDDDAGSGLLPADFYRKLDEFLEGTNVFSPPFFFSFLFFLCSTLGFETSLHRCIINIFLRFDDYDIRKRRIRCLIIF